MEHYFDYSKLIDELYSKGFTCSWTAGVLGLSEREYLRKLASLDEFTQQEIGVLAETVLGINPERIPEYFFNKR